jgi:hypothetical protein
VNPVRPNIWANVPPPGQGAGPAKTAAQRAFFDQALGKATGAAQAQPKAALVQAQPQPAQRKPTDQPAEQPPKNLRPATLLDIRV